MAKRIKIKAHAMPLPNGRTYTHDQEVELTEEQFARIPQEFLNTLILDLDNLPPEPTPIEPASKTKVIAGLDLGSHAANAEDFTWHELPNVGSRGLLTRLSIVPDDAGKYDVELRSSAGAGELYLSAQNADEEYDISIPVYIEGDALSSAWLGIKNKGAAARTYTLTALRVEKFA